MNGISVWLNERNNEFFLADRTFQESTLEPADGYCRFLIMKAISHLFQMETTEV